MTSVNVVYVVSVVSRKLFETTHFPNLEVLGGAVNLKARDDYITQFQLGKQLESDRSPPPSPKRILLLSFDLRCHFLDAIMTPDEFA